MSLEEARERVRRHIRTVRESHALLGSYARGEAAPDGSKVGEGEVRDALGRAVEAVDGMGKALRDLVARDDFESVGAWGEMLEVVEEDAGRARAVLRLVRGEGTFSPGLVASLEGHAHLRALLTDLVLVDRALAEPRTTPS